MYLKYMPFPSGLMVYIEVDYNLPAGCNNLPNPPYFRPATSVTLTCRVEGASGPFTYQWSSSNPNIDVENSISPTVSETILTSDHAGNHTCDVTDGDENTGSSTIEMRLEGEDIKSYFLFSYQACRDMILI